MLVGLCEDLLQKVKAIVEDVIICGIQTALGNESGTEVIANFGLVTVPENVRMNRTALKKEDGKEIAKLISSLHVSCLCKTLLPFTIILQKTTCKTGSFIGWMNHTLKCSEFLPRLWTFDNGQEHPEIIAVASGGVDKVHSPDDITLLAYVPLPDFLVPSEILREVLICDLLCTLQSPIGKEPLCKRSLFGRLAIYDLLQIIVIIEIDHMLIYEMDRQTIDRWLLLMHG
jgi:hypothetical protein